ncbi:aminoacyl-tRNA hydrolase [Buchnera aphidicola (Neophyllaphis podocarpi)]
MNLSGKSVSCISNFYHIETKNILIVHDDLNLSPGKIKIRYGISHGGHNGIKNIINNMKFKSNFYRLSIGIGRPKYKKDVISFVLNKPTLEEKKLILKSIDDAIHITNLWIKNDFDSIKSYLNSLNICLN